MGDTDPSETTQLTDGEKKKLEADQDYSASADPYQDDAGNQGDVKVAYVNGKKDVVLDIDGKAKVEDTDFRGLTKEELMEFANDPFWVRVRYIMLILFWVIWFGMLVAAVLIIVFTPKCPPRPDLTWWEKSVIYDAYPRSFLDTDGNGIGDINGMRKEMDYVLNQVNASALMIGPIHKTDGFGDDVIDYMALDETYGTLKEFTDFRVDMHKRNARIIMDFIPNHTGRNHTWFQASRESKDNDFADYYIWKDGKKDASGNDIPPNNWINAYGNSAWTKDDGRGQYYFHQFLPQQPDLNLTNSKVLAALDEALTFWLKQGVDGFRINSAAYLIENDYDQDEAVVEDKNLTTFQPETYELVEDWNDLLKKYSKDEGRQHPRLLMVEADGTEEQMSGFYVEGDRVMPLNTNLLKLDSSCKAKCVEGLVQKANKESNDHRNNWMLSNQHNSRVSSRMGPRWTAAAGMLLLSLPGTPIIYYGDEIGMHDVKVSFEETKDPVGIEFGQDNYEQYSRDPRRTPMQWTNGNNSGFTSGTPWLPIATDFKIRNVKSQTAIGSALSELEVFGGMAALHEEPSLLWGEYSDSSSGDLPDNENLFSFVRKAERFPGFLVIINFGDAPAMETFYKEGKSLVAASGIIRAHTANLVARRGGSDFEIGTTIDLTLAIHLEQSEGVVIEFI